MGVYTVEREVPVPDGPHIWLNLNQLINGIIAESDFREGFVIIQTKHTTTALLVNEDERGFKNDLLRRLAKMVPDDEYYEHDDFTKRTENIGPDERKNEVSHIRASFLQTSLSPLIFKNRQLQLATWQSVLFIDFDPNGRPSRNLVVQIHGEK